MVSDVYQSAFWYSTLFAIHDGSVAWSKLLNWKFDSISLYTLKLTTQYKLKILLVPALLLTFYLSLYLASGFSEMPKVSVPLYSGLRCIVISISDPIFEHLIGEKEAIVVFRIMQPWNVWPSLRKWRGNWTSLSLDVNYFRPSYFCGL